MSTIDAYFTDAASVRDIPSLLLDRRERLRVVPARSLEDTAQERLYLLVAAGELASQRNALDGEAIGPLMIEGCSLVIGIGAVQRPSTIASDARTKEAWIGSSPKPPQPVIVLMLYDGHHAKREAQR